jgi:hypothetical protein
VSEKGNRIVRIAPGSTDGRSPATKFEVVITCVRKGSKLSASIQVLCAEKVKSLSRKKGVPALDARCRRRWAFDGITIA